MWAMSPPGRSLSYLTTVPIEAVKGLAGARGRAMRNGGVATVTDLLLHAPRRYIDRSMKTPIAEVPVGREVTVVGTIGAIRSRRPRRNLTIVEATIADDSGMLTATWFNQAFRAKQLTPGQEVALSGKVELFRGKLQMKAPAADVLSSPAEGLTTGRVVPIHPSVGEISPGHLRRAIHNALGRSRPIGDPLPVALLAAHGLIGRDEAISLIHFPGTLADVGRARSRLVFDEFFRIEVALALGKHRKSVDAIGYAHTGDGSLVGRFVSGLPYPLTGAQQRVAAEVTGDMSSSHPMHRLLQGEVGSGKTVVAVMALLGAVECGRQAAVMAPTEVLATQHYIGITELLVGAGMAPADGGGALLGMDSLFAAGQRAVTVALLTGSGARVNTLPGVSKAEVVRLIGQGVIDIVVGTHALIQEGVHFAGLTAVVVDEQHRFGVHQRVSLKEKAGDLEPDLLIMTATPIPRTLSMTLYGDLDLSLLDEMPPGREPVATVVVSTSPGDQAGVWDMIRAEARVGRQAFVVCPLVEESAKVEATSAVEEHQRLAAILPELRLGLLHGQLSSDEKQAIMHRMREGDIDVLVATTVIEVGIDIPNATLMVIEDADRFGLSQLHQLRGRVGRGDHPGTCILMADPTTEEAQQRLAAMERTNDGFELAEVDLALRGQGTVFGSRQSGVGDLRLGDILRDADLLVAAREEAFALIAADPGLADHQEIAEEVRVLLGEEVEWLFKS